MYMQTPDRSEIIGNLFSIIDRLALEQPDKAAMHCGDKILTYDRLRRQSNRLARQLTARGISTGDCVGCCVERGGHSLLAILGILKSGATMVPLDETHPKERLDYICTQCGISAFVSDPGCQHLLVEKLELDEARVIRVPPRDDTTEGDDEIGIEWASQDIAYIIYTSGSTGRPKGVRVPYQALYRSIIDGVPAIKMTRDDRCAQLAALTFDAAIWEHLAPLYCGATLVCVPKQAMAMAQTWYDFVAGHAITWTYLPPAFFAQWIAHMREDKDQTAVRDALAGLRCILFAGEALPAGLVREWQGLMGTNVTLMNFYGPTETTVLVCGHVIDYMLPEDVEAIPIGKPFGNNQMVLLDENRHPCPPGKTGRIYIGGPQLAAGYVGDPALTANVFIPNPNDPDETLYDSGDLGYANSHGDIIFAGRQDNQIKLRGKRIELEEVERQLQHLPDVSAAVCFPHETGSIKRLVACVAAPEGTVEQGLKADLGKQVPDYMVPHEILVWPELPINANGKVDRRAARDRYTALKAKPNDPPLPGTGDALERIWQQVLGCGAIGPRDHFFEIGGDSLLLFRALSLARQEGYEVSSDIGKILNENTLAGWRRHLRYVDPEHRRSSRENKAPAVYPLAPMQQEMICLSQAHPGRNLYHIQFVFKTETLDPQLLEQAVQHIIRCHPITRSVFQRVDGILSNVTLDKSVATDFKLNVADLGGDAGDPALRAWMKADHGITFDTAAFPLFRVAYVTTGGGGHLAVTFYHPIFDGWSFSLFVLQIMSTYAALSRGETPPDYTPRGRFSDYADLLKAREPAAFTRIEAAYWQQELRRPLPLVDVPPQRVSRGLTRHAFYLETSRKPAARLKAFAANRGVTLHKVLLAAYFRLFRQLTGMEEMLIGNTVMGRPLELDDADRVLGCFINILPIRIDNAAKPFDALLEDVAAKMDRAAAHNTMANEYHVHTILNEEKQEGMNWRVIFALDNFPETFEIDLLHWPPYSWNAIEPFDIALSVIDLRGRFYCYWNYRSDLFEEEMIRSLGERYNELLESVCQCELAENPS